MKKMRELLWILLVAILLPVALGGCGGGGDSAAKGSGVTTDRPAVILGEMPDLDFMPALLARLTNKTEGEIADDTEVVVLHDRTIGSLTDAQRAGLKKVYERGGIVVLIEPTYDELTEVAGIVGHELAAAVDDGAEHFCDLYAFNGDWHTYVVGHTHVDPTSGDVSLDLAAKEAYYEALMDGLAAWIDEGGPVEGPLPSQNRGNDGGTAQLKDLVKAQTVTFNDTFTRSDMRGVTGFTNTYFIYALYDFDHDYDYYIFDQQAMLMNGPLYKANGWKDDDTYYWGYWLYSYDIFHQIEGTPVGGKYTALPSAVCDIIQPKPTTSIGSTSYTVSESYSWSGSLGFSGLGGTGSLSGGLSYSSSSTTDLSDIQINFRSGQSLDGSATGVDNAYWLYQAQNLPKIRDKKDHSYGVTAPPLIAVNTAVFYNKWIWRVKDPVKNGGMFNTYCVYRPVYTCDTFKYTHWGFATSTTENKDRYDSLKWHIINLTPPPREKPKSATS